MSEIDPQEGRSGAGVSLQAAFVQPGVVPAMVRVLVIEDSETQIRLIRGLLGRHSNPEFSVTSAQNLQSGLDLLCTDEFDAVLLDLTLPDSFGIESCLRVHEIAPEIPFVVLTGVDDEELAISALQHGAEDYLIKGDIGNQLLARAVRYAIERRKAHLALQRAHADLEIRVAERTAELRQAQEEVARRRDELAHASRLHTLGEMASGLAHELNQPLTAIIGFTDHCLHMLRSGRDDPELFEEIMQDASDEAKRAGEIIKRMRRLVTKRETQRAPADLNETVAEAVQLLRPGLDVEVAQDLDASLPEVCIDRVQIQQVILNLGRNAVQAMSESASVPSRLSVRTGFDAVGQVFVEVADTGPGLSREDLERLFDPFFSRKPDGLGLGLSISRTIVESHGGRLTVAPNDTTGLTFRFTLPADRISASNGD